jgi:hypothetical protein
MPKNGPPADDNPESARARAEGGRERAEAVRVDASARDAGCEEIFAKPLDPAVLEQLLEKPLASERTLTSDKEQGRLT